MFAARVFYICVFISTNNMDNYTNVKNARGKHPVRSTLLLSHVNYIHQHHQTYYNTYNKVMKKRQQEKVNVLSTLFPFDDMSWMALTASILQPCFEKDKSDCLYATIKYHAIDIRALDGEKVSPFALNFIENVI